MNAKDQPTEEELRVLREMGMTEVEPGRWVSAPEASSPDMQAFLDNMSPAEQEQLDLLMRAGRVQNEFDMEQTGSDVAVSAHPIAAGPLSGTPPLDEQEHSQVDLAVFVAIKQSSVEDFDNISGDTIETALNQVREEYPLLSPSDAIAVALRKLGIKSKAIHIDAHTAGPDEGPDPRDYPGFRAVLMHFSGGQKFWMD